MLAWLVRAIKAVLTAAIHAFPQTTRDRLADRTYATVARYLVSVVHVAARFPEHPTTFQCLFTGQSALMWYLMKRTFREQGTVRKSKAWRGKLELLWRSHPGEPDLVIARVPAASARGYETMFEYRSQEFVRQIIDISGPWQEIRARFHRNARDAERKIHKLGLTYRLSTSQQDLHLFYHDMFVPHVRAQFGDLADIDSYLEMSRYLDLGFLLLLEVAGQAVAGMQCVVNGDTLIYRRMGMIRTDDTAIDQTARSALYYFMVRLAKDRGFTRVDLMKSRPVLDDTVYLHKRKWGSAVSLDEESDAWVYFRIARRSEGVIRFFERNPIIVVTESGLKGLLGWSGATNMMNASTLVHKYYSPGLAGLLILTSDLSAPVEITFPQSALVGDV